MDQSVLLEELDRRQNEVLEHLSGLNTQIESLLKEWTKNHAVPVTPDSKDPSLATHSAP